MPFANLYDTMTLMDIKEQKIADVFADVTKLDRSHEAVLFIEDGAGDFSYMLGYAGEDISSPFVLASVTKLFTTACVLTLRDQGRLRLDDRLGDYLDEAVLKGLHVFEGKEHAFDLTISALLSHTSGLPDSFENEQTTTASSIKKAFVEEDAYFSFETHVAETKSLSPCFAPGTPGRANYANINYDLLGTVLENIMRQPLSEIYDDLIFRPLGLRDTYLPTNENDPVPGVRHEGELLRRPKVIISTRGFGGGIGSAQDLMVFIKAFWGGRLFNKDVFEELARYAPLQKLMGPINYGIGYMQIPLKGKQNAPTGGMELIGHSGVCSSFAYYCPAKALYFTGTLNQFAVSGLSTKLLTALARAL